MTCDCGLAHTGPCQDAIRKHYEGRIAKLKKALEKYGEHQRDCESYALYSQGTWSGNPCTCGLDEVLKERA